MVSSTCAFSLPVEKYRKPSGVGIFGLSLDMFEIMVAGTARPIFFFFVIWRGSVSNKAKTTTKELTLQS